MSTALRADAPFDPRTLDEAALTTLTDQLYPVHRAIFAGVGRDAFRSYVLASRADRTRVQVFYAADGQVVGYAAVHVFERVRERRKIALMRAEVGLLPAWRGRTAAGALIVREGLRLLVTRPTATRCFAACPVHPASYFAMARNHRAVWPRPGAEPPASVQALLDAIDPLIGLQRPAQAGPLVRDVGWVTRQDPAEARYWSRHPDPLVRYYTEQNPTYGKGHGLLTVMPIDVHSAILGVVGFLRRRLLRRWERVRATRTLRRATA